MYTQLAISASHLTVGFVDVAKSPFAMPIVVAGIWKWRFKALNVREIAYVLALSTIMALFIRHPFNLLDAPRDRLTTAFSELDKFPAVESLARNWHVERTIMPDTATALAFWLFMLTATWGTKSFYEFVFRFVTVLAFISLGSIFFLNIFEHWVVIFSQNGPMLTQISWLHSQLNFFVDLPYTAAASAMLLCTCIGLLFDYMQSTAVVSAKIRYLLQLSVAVVIIGCSIIAIYVLPVLKAVIWILFMLSVFPPVLAFTRADKMSKEGLIKLIRVGVFGSQNTRN